MASQNTTQNITSNVVLSNQSLTLPLPCFLLKLPLELRDMIYGYVLQADVEPEWEHRYIPITSEQREAIVEHTPRILHAADEVVNMHKASRDKRRYNCYKDYKTAARNVYEFTAACPDQALVPPKNNLMPVNTALMRTCSQVCFEVQDYISRTNGVYINVNGDHRFSAREVAALATAQKIRIYLDTKTGFDGTPKAHPWIRQLEAAAGNRGDIQTFIVFCRLPSRRCQRKYGVVRDAQEKEDVDSGRWLKDVLERLPALGARRGVAIFPEQLCVGPRAGAEIKRLEEAYEKGEWPLVNCRDRMDEE